MNNVILTTKSARQLTTGDVLVLGYEPYMCFDTILRMIPCGDSVLRFDTIRRLQGSDASMRTWACVGAQAVNVRVCAVHDLFGDVERMSRQVQHG